MFNLIDLPAGIVPVTFENDEDQAALATYPGGDKMHKDAKNVSLIFPHLFLLLVHQFYSCPKCALVVLLPQATKGAVGLPLAVQLVGLPFAEASVLHVMKELELGMKDAGAAPDLLHSRDPWKFAQTE